MKIKNATRTELILQEIGTRLTKKRNEAGLTQAALAQKADVSKRTVERIESGCSIQLSTMIQVLRVFDMLEALDSALDGKMAVKKLAKKVVRVKETPKMEIEPRSPKSHSWGYES